MPGRNCRRQDGCWNCRHCILHPQEDNGFYALICIVDGKTPDDRALTISDVQAGGYDWDSPFKKWYYANVYDDGSTAAHKMWQDWYEPRRVDNESTCGNWEAKDAG